MGFMDKLKGFFYDEEEVEEEVEVSKRREIPKKKPIIVEKEKNDVSERELFRAERTFNFPMNMDDDEPDYTPTQKSIKKDTIANAREVVNKKTISNNYNSNVRKPYSAVTVKKEEEKKFKPTPIISPIYGIIEGEYAKSESSSKSLNDTKEFGTTKKIDFDTVRKKAYGEPRNNYEKENEQKGLFFNLVDEEKVENTNFGSDNFEEDDIKITYNDVDYDDEDDEIEIPKITRLKKNEPLKEEKENISDEDAILSETKEQDLFNLIDNMYNSEEDEEDEE